MKKRKVGEAFVIVKEGKGKRRKKAAGTRTVIQGGNVRTFVPRSFGNPMAIVERKYFDSTRTSNALVSWAASTASGEQDPGTLNTLFAPIQGDDYLNRQGRKVQVLSLKIRGTITYALQEGIADPPTFGFVRLLLVQDKQTNAAQLNSEDVVTGTIFGFQNAAFFGRFRVIKDKIINLQKVAVSVTGANTFYYPGDQFPFKMKIKFRKPVLVHFNSTNGGTVADIIDNSFHIITGASSITTAPAITYTCRTTFVDI